MESRYLKQTSAHTQQKSHVIVRGLRLLFLSPKILVRYFYRLTYRYVTDAAGDYRYGISTGLWRSTGDDMERQLVGYEPVPYSTLGDIHRHARRMQCPTRLFIDVGCGHGRPLYYFSPFFDDAIGYEIDEEIFQAATEQLTKKQEQERSFGNVKIFNRDATADLAITGPSVVYLYNPFGPAPMARFCETMKNTAHRLDIYYVNPLHVRIMEQRLGVQSEEISSFVGVRYLCYRPDRMMTP